MKRLFFIALYAIVPFCALCQKYVDAPTQSSTKEFEKLITEHDVLPLLDLTRKGDPVYFWEIVNYYNKDLNKFNIALQKNKSAARNVYEEIDEQPYTSYLLREFIVQQNIEQIEKVLCGENPQYDINAIIIDDETINACATPRGEIIITTAMLDFIKKDKADKLLGIYAHEMSHYVLQHYAVNKWKEKKNESWIYIAAGAVAAAEVTAGVVASAGGMQSSINEENIINMAESTKEVIEMSKFKHSREQEIEADIIAIRFMEWIDVDPWSYIEFLKETRVLGDGANGYMSDHPKTKYRIELLSHLLRNHSMTECKKTPEGVSINEEGWLRLNALNKCLSELGYTSDKHIGAAYFINEQDNWDALWDNRLRDILYERMKDENITTIEEHLEKLKAAYDLMNQES